MYGIMFITLFIVMLITTIALYEAMSSSKATEWLVQLMDKNVLLAAAVNFGISSIIVLFTGEGTASGAANLAASIVFPTYCVLKRKVFKVPYRFTYGKGTVAVAIGILVIVIAVIVAATMTK